MMNSDMLHEFPTNAIYLLMLKLDSKLMTLQESGEKFTLYFSAKNVFGITGTYKVPLEPIKKCQQNHYFMPTSGAHTAVK